MDDADAAEAKPGTLTKEYITGVLKYLGRRKKHLAELLVQMEDSRKKQICTTDPECRLMKTGDGIRPGFNVQTAVETDKHLLVDYEVTHESSPIFVFTARFPVGFHFTVRPFAAASWTFRGANEGIFKSILSSGLLPTKSSTFAVPFIFPLPGCLYGFIYRGANFGMGILFAGLP